MRTALLAMTGFLGVTAVAGGIGLLTTTLAPGTEQLDGSPFGSYTVPGLVLLMIGIVALAGTVLMKTHHPAGHRVAIIAGALIMVFEVVQVVYIDFHILQPAYFVLGAVMVAFGVQVHPERRPDSAETTPPRAG